MDKFSYKLDSKTYGNNIKYMITCLKTYGMFLLTVKNALAQRLKNITIIYFINKIDTTAMENSNGCVNVYV